MRRHAALVATFLPYCTSLLDHTFPETRVRQPGTEFPVPGCTTTSIACCRDVLFKEWLQTQDENGMKPEQIMSAFILIDLQTNDGTFLCRDTRDDPLPRGEVEFSGRYRMECTKPKIPTYQQLKPFYKIVSGYQRLGRVAIIAPYIECRSQDPETILRVDVRTSHYYWARTDGHSNWVNTDVKMTPFSSSSGESSQAGAVVSLSGSDFLPLQPLRPPGKQLQSFACLDIELYS